MLYHINTGIKSELCSSSHLSDHTAVFAKITRKKAVDRMMTPVIGRHFKQPIFPLDDFKLTQGEMKSFRRPDLDSPVTRYFCETCGTSLATETPKRPGSIVIKVGTLDDPSVFTPGAAIFTCDKQAFHHIPDDIPTFDKRPG